MAPGTLSEWLSWQENLNTAEIDLGLDRVRDVFARLNICPPPGRVFTVAGTNGKGSCAAALDAVLRSNGLTTGLYTSPHLVDYNERVRVCGDAASDAELMAAFAAIEAVRGDTPLTFFEFGTLAAMLVFAARDCNAWVLEIGLGGRLDAVNVVDPDIALITSIGLDHQEWLGDTVEAIAFEKAGIMRTGQPAFYGEQAVPETMAAHAAAIGADFSWLGNGFDCRLGAADWCWFGRHLTLDDLELPAGQLEAQVRNQAVALAGLEACDPQLLGEPDAVRAALSACALPGRLQSYLDDHLWLLDVAHNPHAAAGLVQQLSLDSETPTTVVIGMLADKQAAEFVRGFESAVDRWIVCPVDAARGGAVSQLADALAAEVHGSVEAVESVTAGLSAAREYTPVGGRIVVCGSFYVVGPALRWLGLY